MLRIYRLNHNTPKHTDQIKPVNKINQIVNKIKNASSDDISMISLNTIIGLMFFGANYVDPKKNYTKGENVSKYITYAIITASSTVVIYKVIKILK